MGETEKKRKKHTQKQRQSRSWKIMTDRERERGREGRGSRRRIGRTTSVILAVDELAMACHDIGVFRLTCLLGPGAPNSSVCSLWSSLRSRVSGVRADLPDCVTAAPARGRRRCSSSALLWSKIVEPLRGSSSSSNSSDSSSSHYPLSVLVNVSQLCSFA